MSSFFGKKKKESNSDGNQNNTATKDKEKPKEGSKESKTSKLGSFFKRKDKKRDDVQIGEPTLKAEIHDLDPTKISITPTPQSNSASSQSLSQTNKIETDRNGTNAGPNNVVPKSNSQVKSILKVALSFENASPLNKKKIAWNNSATLIDGWGETHKTALHDSEDELEELNQFDELQQHSNERVISALEAVQKQFMQHQSTIPERNDQQVKDKPEPEPKQPRPTSPTSNISNPTFATPSTSIPSIQASPENNTATPTTTTSQAQPQHTHEEDEEEEEDSSTGGSEEDEEQPPPPPPNSKQQGDKATTAGKLQSANTEWDELQEERIEIEVKHRLADKEDEYEEIIEKKDEEIHNLKEQIKQWEKNLEVISRSYLSISFIHSINQSINHSFIKSINHSFIPSLFIHILISFSCLR